MFIINRNTLSNAVTSVKDGFTSAAGHAVKFASSLPQHHHTAKKMLGDVNDAYSTAKKAYSVLEPKVGNPSINNHVLNALNGYEATRTRVMDGHDAVVNTIEQVKAGKKKAGVRPVFQRKEINH